jgi:hypothetical protein
MLAEEMGHRMPIKLTLSRASGGKDSLDELIDLYKSRSEAVRLASPSNPPR